MSSLDGQQVEVLGRSALIAALMTDGLEIAQPEPGSKTRSGSGCEPILLHNPGVAPRDISGPRYFETRWNGGLFVVSAVDRSAFVGAIWGQFHLGLGRDRRTSGSGWSVLTATTPRRLRSFRASA